MKTSMRLLIIFKLIFLPVISYSQVDSIFKIFQFPADKIPRIDGNPDDWEIVPDSYIIGSDQLKDDEKKHSVPDPKNLDVKVKVGWVDGINKLYFLYEAYDDYWEIVPDSYIIGSDQLKDDEKKHSVPDPKTSM